MTTMISPHLLDLDDTPGCILCAGDIVFPLTAAEVTGRVDGSGIVWTVTQTFANPLTEPAEALYTFPLTHDGAVNAMTMTIGERTIEAEIKEREQAENEYHEAIALGHTAGLVTQERAEIFTTAVGNIHPGEVVSVTITIHGTVSIDEDVATLRFPTMIKQRYSRDDLPDAGRLDAPGIAVPVPVQSSVTVEFTEPVAGLVSETFPDAAVSDQTVVISGDSALQSDVVLRWDVPRTFASARWVADVESGGDESGSGTLEVTIRTEPPARPVRARHAVSVLLDRSGSMGGHYMEWARRIGAAVIASLSDDDLVHVLAFDDVMEPFDATAHGFVEATRLVRTSLLRELETVQARGGTELETALAASGAAFATLDDSDTADSGRERVAIVLTDGAIGDEALAMRFRRTHLDGVRVISVAIGENANGFLQALSADGTCLFLEAEHQVAETAIKVASRIGSRAHRNTRLVVEGIAEQAPSPAPDIYPELVTRLWGRMSRPANGATVEIQCDDGTIDSLPIEISRDGSICTRWASARIKSLDADVMAAADSEDAERLETQIVGLSVKHRVLSKYTAWLAVDRTRTTDTIVIRTLVQPRYDDALDLAVNFLALPSMGSASPDVCGFAMDLVSCGPDPFHSDQLAPNRRVLDLLAERLEDLQSAAFPEADEIAELLDELRSLLEGITTYSREDARVVGAALTALKKLEASVAAGRTDLVTKQISALLRRIAKVVDRFS